MNDEELFKNVWPKVCPVCNASYDEESWESLPYVGIQRGMYSVPDLELRNCDRCQDTMSIVCPTDVVGMKL